MSNISDKDLDKLFREAAEGYQTSFDESAWEDMERRMDDGGDDGFSYFKILGGIIGILLLGSVVIWWVSSENQGVLSGGEISQVATQSQSIEGIGASGVDAENASGKSGQDIPDRAVGGEEEPKQQVSQSNMGDQGNDKTGQNSNSGEHDESGQHLRNEHTNDQQHLYHGSGVKGESNGSGTKGEQLEKGSGELGRNVVDASARQKNRNDVRNKGYLTDVNENQSDEHVAKATKGAGEAGSIDSEGDSADSLWLKETKESGFAGSNDERNPTGLKLTVGNGEMVSDRQSDDKNGVEGEVADQASTHVKAHGGDDKEGEILAYTNKEVPLADNGNSEPEDSDDKKLSAEKEGDDPYSKDKHGKDRQVWVYSPAFLNSMSYLDYEYPYSFDHRELNKVEEPVRSDVEEKEQEGRRGLALKITYSPDLTSVGYFKPDRPGSNFGLMGSYFINRWSISTGAIYSRKIYFSEESSGGGYYSGPSDFTRIDGDCKVVDIPINFSYYLSNNINHGFYFSTGFSSYIMLKENYDFLTRSNGTEREWSSEYENENNHFFSILNLSIGYERQIKNRFFIQLEPFVKAPVSGIGEGKVDLVSTGAFLNLMYKFNH